MGSNLQVINASAGSGKTTLLINKFLYLILQSNNPLTFKKVLAITFTNKAAQEMKERLIEALTKIANQSLPEKDAVWQVKTKLNLSDEEFKTRAANSLTNILHNYSDLSISTIDAFVFKLIKTFAKDLNLPSNLEVELDIKNTLMESVELLIEKISESKLLENYLTNFAIQLTEDDKSWKIESKIRDFFTQFIEAENYEKASIFKKLPLQEFQVISDYCNKVTHEIETKLSKQSQKALQIIENEEIPGDVFHRGNSSGLKSVYEKINSGSYSNSRKTLYEFINEDKLYNAKKAKNYIDALERIKPQLYEITVNFVKEIDELIQEHTIAAAVKNHIYQFGLLNELNKILQEQKNENGFILISDFNQIVSEAIAQESAEYIYLRTGERFNHIFIDEFQDTSVQQWSNMLPLVENSLANGHQAVLVGDVKQSIYRFRGGEAEQLANFPEPPKSLKKSEILQRYNQLKNFYNQTEYLDTNYRSCENIVEFNNRFFDVIKDHIQPEFQNYFQGYKQKAGKIDQIGYIEIVNLPKDNYDEIQLEKLLQLIKRKEERKIQLKNICVLCRTGDHVKQVTSFLSQNQIPVISAEGLLVVNSVKVSLLVALINYIHATEISPQGNATLWYWFAKNNIHIKANLKSKTANLVKQFFGSDFFIELKAMLINEQVQALAQKLGFFENPDGFIVTFLNAVQEILQKEGDSFLVFSQWWKNKKDKLAIASAENTNAISVMTIHKAKGLQYDVVILPFFKKLIQVRDYHTWVSLPNAYKIPMAYLPVSNDNMAKFKVETEYSSEKQKNLLDELNNIYVAFTRAKKELFVFGMQNESKNPNPTSSYHNLLNDALEKISFLNQKNEHTFIHGIEPEEEKPSPPEKPTAPNIWFTEWRKQVKVSVTANYEQLKSLDYGKKMHSVFAHLQPGQDFKKVFEKFEISEEDEKLITKITQQPLLNEVFYGNQTQFIEKDILLPNGRKYRPDRVVITKTKTILLDFKTGEYHEKYKKQMDNYAQILSEMGYSNIQKYLVLISSGELKMLN